jgi:hypothetical protein
VYVFSESVHKISSSEKSLNGFQTSEYHLIIHYKIYIIFYENAEKNRFTELFIAVLLRGLEGSEFKGSSCEG